MSPLIQAVRAIPTRYLVGLILLLFVPAHLLNLGVAAFIGDEAIRSLVALEMDFSGNYIATTMQGAPYINKPPLFNWILLLAFKFFGYFGELPARTVTVFFLAIYGWVIYQFTRRELGRELAFLAALMTITTGRFLIYDSMLGLIDTTFSVVVYSLILSMWYFGSRGQWLRLFLVSYGLMVIGFLLKGLPAIVFQGLSLIAALCFFGAWRRLFSWQHIGVGLLSVLALSVYFGVYAQYRSLEVLLHNLLNESVKRTAVEFGWQDTVLHFFQFPLDSIYHFLPFSLLILAWVDRRFWERIRQNRFVYFHFVLLAVNLPIYWSSVQVYARYLLMFIPLFTVLSLYLMEQHRAENNWRYKLFFGLMGVLAALLPLAFGAMPFVPEVNFLPHIWPASIICSLFLGILALGFFGNPQRYLYWVILALLVGRIGFDVIVLPARHHQNDTSMARDAAREMADKYKDRTWYCYGDSYFREPAAFYVSERLGYIVQRTCDLSLPNALYVINKKEEPNGAYIFEHPPVDTLKTDYSDVQLLLFIRE